MLKVEILWRSESAGYRKITDMTKMQTEKSKARILYELFVTYFTGMMFSLTGGNMTWPLVQQKLTDRYQLMDRDKTLEYYALGQSLPGVLTLNTALMIGKEVAGLAGSFAAAIGIILPAFLGMLIVTLLYTWIIQFPVIGRALQGMRAGAIAIIASNGIDIIKNRKTIFARSIIVMAILLPLVFRTNILWIILGSGMLGIIKVLWDGKRPKKHSEKDDRGEGDREKEVQP